jgi:hypothetical protein
MADRIAGNEVRRQLVDNGCDHRVQVRDLVMQFEVAAGQRLEADTIGGLQVAICGQIGPPRAFTDKDGDLSATRLRNKKLMALLNQL